MAFYTADWFKKLAREDHKFIQEYISKKDNDIRGYIDSTLPFTLFLDIGSIRKNILQPEAKAIQDLTQLLGLQNPDSIIQELDKAYQNTINEYIDGSPQISGKELQNILEKLNQSIQLDNGTIKSTIQELFKKTVVIKELSKRNKSVLILSPKFRTIQDRFGSRVKANFNYSAFSDLIDDSLGNSPRNIIKGYLDKNFAVLQNLGHVEIDILSSKEGSSEVKRGLVSPRLLQALLEWPKDAKPDRLVRTFSKETGQAETRIIVRKKFNNTKLVLEMLIESGMMIGSLESQAENLAKAPKEAKFGIGKALTARLRQNKSLLLDLVTSKSLRQYVQENLKSHLTKGKSSGNYNSKTTIVEKTKISRSRTKVQLPTTKEIVASVPKLSKSSQSVSSLTNLETLLRAGIADTIKKNMGKGDRRDILNLRSGRFAESVTIERISRSRAGMLSVYYNYMKYPYATFSAGGKQSNPRTRDPKLLISSSIREIAQKSVSDRMRAVLV
jgi:hypothetical protein